MNSWQVGISNNKLSVKNVIRALVQGVRGHVRETGHNSALGVCVFMLKNCMCSLLIPMYSLLFGKTYLSSVHTDEPMSPLFAYHSWFHANQQISHAISVIMPVFICNLAALQATKCQLMWQLL